MAVGSEGLQTTRQLFLTLMSCIYLFAFSSLYTQIPGLYGSNGLAPVHNVVPDPPPKGESCIASLRTFNSLVTLYPCLQVSPSMMMELCCLAGVVLSMLMIAFRFMRNALSFLFLWLLYFSLFKVGQVFLWFQWDTLLLEAGILTVMVAPFIPISPWQTRVFGGFSDGMTLWLVRWLLFRLMFASGVVKLTSQCPTWWGLTALNYHYETQCIPTPVSWYAHQFPVWLQKLSVVATYFIEIAVPFLFFLPVRSLRLLGFFSQVFLQVLIIITGNYNFFNLLTITLSISLLDDHFLGYGNRESSSTSVHFSRVLRKLFCSGGRLVERSMKDITFLSIVGLLLALTIYYFQIAVDWPNRQLLSSVGFNKIEFDTVLRVSVPACVVMATISLCIEALSAFMHAIQYRGLPGKFRGLIEWVGFGMVCSFMFVLSIPSIGELDSHFMGSVPANVKKLHNDAKDFSLTSSYGLFRRMTGVGGRPEVIIEGTNGNDLEKAVWKEYNFLYKPGDLNAPLSFVAPHQPRLDWQMWFAALGHYKNNPWLVHLVYKLLIGERDVLQLMGTPPFSKPPKHVRARLYHYHFTSLNSTDSLLTPGPWWRREFRGDYLYVLSKDNTQLLDFLKSQNYLTKPSIPGSKTVFNAILTRVRAASSSLSPPVFLWSLFFTALTILLTMSCMCSRRARSPPARINIASYLADLAPVDEAAGQQTSKRAHWRRGDGKRGKSS